MAPQVIELAGKRFGRWTVLSYAGNRLWVCRCDCGTERGVPGVGLRNGTSRSCGCLAAENAGNRARSHGQTDSPEWKSWRSMMKRCYQPSHDSYPDYGGKGIIVCARWHDFASFLADMGRKPDASYTLDRFPDTNGNYEPGNCRWATAIEQGNNRTVNRMIVVDGETMNVTQAARRFGIPRAVIFTRLRSGWTHERAVTQPVAHKKVRHVNDSND